MYVLRHQDGRMLVVTPTAYRAGRFQPLGFTLEAILPTATERRAVRIPNTTEEV